MKNERTSQRRKGSVLVLRRRLLSEVKKGIPVNKERLSYVSFLELKFVIEVRIIVREEKGYTTEKEAAKACEERVKVSVNPVREEDCYQCKD